MLIYLYILLIVLGILLWFIPNNNKKDNIYFDNYYFILIIIISFILGLLLNEKWYLGPIMINIGQLIYLIIYSINIPFDLFLLSLCYILLQTIFMLIPAGIGYMFS